MTKAAANVGPDGQPSQFEPRHNEQGKADRLADRGANRLAETWLNNQAKDTKKAIWLAILAGAAGGALVIAQAMLLAWVLHQVIMEKAELSQVAWPLAALAMVYLGRAVMAYVGGLAGFHASAQVRQVLRDEVCQKIHDLGPAHSGQHQAGDLLSKALDQIEALDGYYARYLPQKALAVAVPFAMTAAVFPLDWLAGVIFLITLPLVPLFMALAGMGAAAASRDQAESLARMSGFFLDRLRNIAVIKGFGQAERELAAVARVSHDYRDRALGVLKLAFISSAVLEFFTVVAIALVALYVGMSLLGLFQIGPTADVTLFIGLFVLLLAPEVFLPLRKLAVYYHERATALAAAELLQDILELPTKTPQQMPQERFEMGQPLPEPSDSPGPPELPDPPGILMKDVHKSYDGGTRAVLKDFNLTVTAGEKIALVGPSGVGKSTLISLLMGFETPDQGTITIRLPKNPRTEDHYPGAPAAWLGQKPHLFHGSIADNILLGRPGASTEEVTAAAQKAKVFDFAQQLPHGMDTLLGEDGHGLSGGEAQRVALARAFLRDAPLLLLDEPTARLDRDNEAAILSALDQLLPGRTVLVATHSAAVIARMDRVITLSPLASSLTAPLPAPLPATDKTP